MRFQFCRRHPIDARRPSDCVLPPSAPVGSSRLSTTASIRFSYIALRRKVRGVPASPRRSRLAAAAPLLPPALPAWPTVVVASVIRARLLRRSPVPSLAPFFSSSALRSSRHYRPSSLLRPLLTSPPLSREEISPGKVQNLSPRAVWLYLMRLDDLWASLFRASLPPAPGLTASSCSYGREFASRFFRLHLAATPCGSLRLPSSAPIGSFHPTRFCPCWAHAAAALPRGVSAQARPIQPHPARTCGRVQPAPRARCLARLAHTDYQAHVHPCSPSR